MDFYRHVYTLVRRIPAGQVATYGQIASMISSPRAARMVGMALRSLPEGSDVPWQRVVGAGGRITIDNLDHPAEEQANLLMAEGVVITREEDTYIVDLEKHVWRPLRIAD